MHLHLHILQVTDSSSRALHSTKQSAESILCMHLHVCVNPWTRPGQANPAAMPEPFCDRTTQTSPVRVLKTWVGLQTRPKPQKPNHEQGDPIVLVWAMVAQPSSQGFNAFVVSSLAIREGFVGGPQGPFGDGCLRILLLIISPKLSGGLKHRSKLSRHKLNI
jgi:hypothetical protein